MQGIEILKQTEILEPSFGTFFIVLLSVLPVLNLGIIAIFKDDDFLLLIGFFSSLILVLILVPITISQEIGMRPTGEYEYKVTISDEVNFNEFNEKYEIISQDGDIYTIRERKED